ncbi:MAG: hypothetical protein V5A64_00010 [Candidatus Thermoplasmatota archaeon]
MGVIARKEGDSYGLIAIILGVVAIVLLILMAFVVYVYVSNILPPPSHVSTPTVAFKQDENIQTGQHWVNLTVSKGDVEENGRI